MEGGENTGIWAKAKPFKVWFRWRLKCGWERLTCFCRVAVANSEEWIGGEWR